MSILWQSCYGGSDHDKATDIVETENGYIIIGQANSNDSNISNYHGGYDFWVIRIDSTGFIEWERCYGGSGYEIGGRIISDSEGNYYIAGSTSSNDGDIQSGNYSGDYSVWVVKINGDGDILWEKCFGGSGGDLLTSISLLSNGNILIAAQSTSPDGDLPANYGYIDSWIFIISPVGEIIQNEVFGNDLHNSVQDVIKTGDGGYLFKSSTSSTNGMVNGTYHGGMSDVWLVKLDSNLNIEWQMLYGGSNGDFPAKGLVESTDGYIFLAGTDSNDGDVSGFHGGIQDIWVVRIDIVGNIIWQTCLGGSDYDVGGDLFQTEDGGFMVFGYTMSNNGDVSGNNSWPGYSDIWMVKLNSAGEIEWQLCYGGLNDEFIYSGIIKKSDHNWVFAGSTKYNTGDVDCTWHGYEDYWVFEIKDTSTGVINNNHNEIGITLYPNPAKNYIQFGVRGLTFEVGEVRIFDVFGRQATAKDITSEQTILDVSRLPNGIYFYRVAFEDISYSGKFVIQEY